MKTFTAVLESQTIAARTEWGVPGGYFKLLASTANVAIELFSGGVRVLNAPSVPAGFYQTIDFDKIVITGAAAITWLAAPDEGGLDTLVATISGSVTVEGPGTVAVDANQAFIGDDVCGAVAANFSHCEVFNPPASGKTVYVESVEIGGAPVASEYFLTAGAGASLTTLAKKFQSKVVGGANAVAAELRRQNNAAPFGPLFFRKWIPANETRTIVFTRPIRLNPNNGLIGGIATVNQPLNFAAEVREV